MAASGTDRTFVPDLIRKDFYQATVTSGYSYKIPSMADLVPQIFCAETQLGQHASTDWHRNSF